MCSAKTSKTNYLDICFIMMAMKSSFSPNFVSALHFAVLQKLKALGLAFHQSVLPMRVPLLSPCHLLCNHILSQDHDYGYDIIVKQMEAKAQV